MCTVMEPATDIPSQRVEVVAGRIRGGTSSLKWDTLEMKGLVSMH